MLKSHGLAITLCLLATVQPTFAPPVLKTTSWTGTTGSWFSVGNWGNGVPTSDTNAYVNNSGTALIGTGENAQADGLNVGSGAVNISGGSLTVNTLWMNGGGVLRIQDSAAVITVKNNLSFYSGSALEAVAGSALHMTGSYFWNYSTHPTDYAGLNNLNIVFEGGVATIDDFEVAGQDVGTNSAGLNLNFALDALTLGGADVGNLRLVNSHDNQPDWIGTEALYVGSLNLAAGSLLDLNGLNLYYGDATIDPTATITLNGGSLILLPEPAAFGWLALAAAPLLLRRLRRSRSA